MRRAQGNWGNQRSGGALKKLTMLLCALGIVVLSAGLVACGDDDDDDDSAATEAATTTEASTDSSTVDVTGVEYSFELSATPTADTQEITFTNDGAEEHNLIFARINEGFTLEEAIKEEGEKGTAEEIGFTFAKPGEEGKPIEIKQPLEPGNYAMICTVSSKDGPPHFELGMQEEFTIE
jgi:plastocyanin